MTVTIPHRQVTLLFPSIAAISKFKNACACNNFYIDRDALTMVGSFTEKQVAMAVNEFGAQAVPEQE